MTSATIHLDVVIFGGGAAGLWLLDDLHRAGYGVLLLEASALGSGQTICSQGIIHGGLKYTLDGLLTPSARAIREMPGLWRACLRGEREPALTDTRVLADFCHLWRTEGLGSRIGLVGAVHGLRVGPQKVARKERPAVLAKCPGEVYRLDEQVIACDSFLKGLAQRHVGRTLLVDRKGCSFERNASGVRSVCARWPERSSRSGSGEVTLVPRYVALTAGAGNADLCAALRIDVRMQRRPLHMLMLRGDLPELYGHCVDRAHTRVTITSARDGENRAVWQVGGQVAEDGVKMSEAELIRHGRRELQAAIPGLSLDGVEWAAYRVDRAEAGAAGGVRPATETVKQVNNVVAAWPTKLALAPRMAQVVRQRLPRTEIGQVDDLDTLKGWPRPQVAKPQWEVQRTWRRDV